MVFLMNRDDFSAVMTREARDSDKKLFKDWERHRISTEECCHQYLKNNHVKIRTRKTINYEAFRLMMEGLGYRRLGNE